VGFVSVVACVNAGEKGFQVSPCPSHPAPEHWSAPLGGGLLYLERLFPRRHAHAGV